MAERENTSPAGRESRDGHHNAPDPASHCRMCSRVATNPWTQLCFEHDLGQSHEDNERKIEERKNRIGGRARLYDV